MLFCFVLFLCCVVCYAYWLTDKHSETDWRWNIKERVSERKKIKSWCLFKHKTYLKIFWFCGSLTYSLYDLSVALSRVLSQGFSTYHHQPPHYTTPVLTQNKNKKNIMTFSGCQSKYMDNGILRWRAFFSYEQYYFSPPLTTVRSLRKKKFKFKEAL